MLLLALLAATMLVASPVLAHQGGPTHGNKYSKNYYPTSYFKYCEPDGAKYYGDTKASKNSWCDKYYKEYTEEDVPRQAMVLRPCLLQVEDTGRPAAYAGLLVLLPVPQVQ